MVEDEKVGWHHQFNGHESEQILGDSERQRTMTEQHQFSLNTILAVSN